VQRAILAFSIAATAAFAAPPVSAQPAYCGDTFQPQCEYCLVEWTPGAWICVNIGVETPGG